MRTKPKASLHSNIQSFTLDEIINRLKFLSFLYPNILNFLCSELIFSQEGDDPSEHLSFVRIIQIIIIVICIVVLFDWKTNVLYGGYCSYLFGCFIIEHFSDVFDHRFPIDLVESLSQLGQNVRKAGLPYMAQGKGSPKHLSVIESRDSTGKIICGRYSLFIYKDPRHISSKSWILSIKFLESRCFLLDQSKDFCGRINLVGKLGIFQYLRHDCQMNGLFTTSCKFMKCFKQKFTSLYINPNAIQSQSCSLVNSDFFNKVHLPLHIFSQKLINLILIFNQLLHSKVFSESAIASSSDFQSKRDQNNEEKEGQTRKIHLILIINIYVGVFMFF